MHAHGLSSCCGVHSCCQSNTQEIACVSGDPPRRRQFAPLRNLPVSGGQAAHSQSFHKGVGPSAPEPRHCAGYGGSSPRREVERNSSSTYVALPSSAKISRKSTSKSLKSRLTTLSTMSLSASAPALSTACRRGFRPFPDHTRSLRLAH